MTSIAKLLGVSRSTLYSALPGLVPAQRDDQAALQDRLTQIPPDARPGLPTVEQSDQLATRPDGQGAVSR
ncbi:hypothetical protein [Micromonospora echinofusca]|uniref:hypothetical protein n=1 Tax=Micromonospora echinofusca TaxID=47858 RepID=UPI003405B346